MVMMGKRLPSRSQLIPAAAQFLGARFGAEPLAQPSEFLSLLETYRFNLAKILDA
jgi:hypothetical protein